MSQQSLAVHAVETLAKIVHRNFVVTWLKHFGIFRTYRVVEKHEINKITRYALYTRPEQNVDTFKRKKRLYFDLSLFLMVQMKISQYWLRQVSTSSGNGLVLSGNNKSLPEPMMTKVCNVAIWWCLHDFLRYIHLPLNTSMKWSSVKLDPHRPPLQMFCTHRTIVLAISVTSFSS